MAGIRSFLAVKRSFLSGLVLLCVLAVLAQAAPQSWRSYSGAAQASPPNQPPGPGQTDDQPASPVLPQPGASAQEVTAAATPGISYLTYSSLLFKPLQGNTSWNYNYTYGTLNLSSPSTAAEFALSLSLPDRVNIRELTYHFIDNQAGKDLLMGLCRVPLGESAFACLHWQVYSVGINSTAVITRTLYGNPIETVNNSSYSYFLLVYLNGVNAQYGVISARIGYSMSSYIPVVGR